MRWWPSAHTLDQRYGAVTAYTFSDGVCEQGKDVVDLTVHVIRHQSVCDVHGQISWVGGTQLIVDKAKWKILQADGL